MDFEDTEDNIMYADVPTQGMRTLYPHIGDIFGWMCVVGFLGIVIVSLFMRKPKKTVQGIAEASI
jgi:hypothetical protein